ncbi:hypothetical protein Leryth_003269 [Lithospermum erythrorhizon]|nr:hypothetical protein Leryth_003269 [Lithospermum erythrorhizon]
MPPAHLAEFTTEKRIVWRPGSSVLLWVTGLAFSQRERKSLAPGTTHLDFLFSSSRLQHCQVKPEQLSMLQDKPEL